MSIDIFIAFRSERIPTARAWADRVLSEGFDVRIDQGFDPKSFSGYVPCRGGAGFEYSVAPIESELPALGLSTGDTQRLSGMDTMACLSYRTENDLAVAQPAAAAFALVTDGVVMDGESGSMLTPAEALEWARGDYALSSVSPSPSPAVAPRAAQWTAFRIGKLVLLAIVLATVVRSVLG